MNKNNISTVCYFFIDLMEFNCSFFDIFFEIVNLDNRVEDTLFLINNTHEYFATAIRTFFERTALRTKNSKIFEKYSKIEKMIN